MNGSVPTPGGRAEGFGEERVIERGYHPSGGLAYERAILRVQPCSANEFAPDPLWLEVLTWVLAAAWRGFEILGQAVLTVLMLVLGLIGAALGLVVILGL